MDCSTAKCYSSDQDSYPCPQGHQPHALTNFAISPLRIVGCRWVVGDVVWWVLVGVLMCCCVLGVGVAVTGGPGCRRDSCDPGVACREAGSATIAAARGPHSPQRAGCWGRPTWGVVGPSSFLSSRPPLAASGDQQYYGSVYYLKKYF